MPTIQIARTFAGEFHTRSVRSLATGKHLVASGGADDRIRVYDLAERTEVKELFNHTGMVNSLVFVENGKYLISGGEDGKIVFTNTRNWQVDKEWEKAHKGAVRCIAVHPEESLALTIGADMVLKSWNLVTGRCVYSTNLKNKTQYGGIVENVRWSPDGEHFAITGAKIVEVLSLETGAVVRSHALKYRVTDMCWIGEADLLVGQDNGELFFFNVETEESGTIPAHDARLKAMQYVDGLLVTVSSAGELSLWSIPDDYSEIILLRTYNINCRPICLCVVESSKLGLSFEKLAAVEEIEDDVKVEEEEEGEGVLSQANEHQYVEKRVNGGQPSKFKKKKKFRQSTQVDEETVASTSKIQTKSTKCPVQATKKKIEKKKKIVNEKKFKKKVKQVKAMQFEESDIVVQTNGTRSSPKNKKKKGGEVKYFKKKTPILT